MSSSIQQVSGEKSHFRFYDPFKKDRDLIYKHIGLTKKITKYYQYGAIILLISLTLIIQITKLLTYIAKTRTLNSTSSSSKSFWSIQSLKLQSFLLTKPSLPIFSYLFNDYKTCIIISTYYLINAFVFWYKLPMDDSFNLALRAGLVSGTNIPLLYLIPLKSGPLLYLINQSYENMIVYHKFIGILVVLMALVHGAAFSYCLSWDYLLNDIKAKTGFGSISAFIVLAIASTGVVRNKFYELFYYLHISSFVLFLPIFYHHHYVCKPFVIFVTSCLAFDRIIRWFSKIWVLECEVLSIDPEDDMLILSIDTDIGKLSKFQKFISFLLFKTSNSNFTWDLSNHLFINIPKIKLLQSHPFTIANTPDSKNPILIIKIHSGFTKKLFNKAQQNKRFTCFIHGPYGNSAQKFPNIINPDPFMELPIPYRIINHETTPLIEPTKKQKSYTQLTTISNLSSISSLSSMNYKRQKIILICGGAGVSFTLPLLNIYHNNPLYDVSFIWVIRNTKPLRQIKFDKRDDIIIWCTQQRGRPNVKNLLYDTINTTYSKINIMACGPNSLIHDIKKFSTFEIEKGNDINLITEEFSF